MRLFFTIDKIYLHLYRYSIIRYSSDSHSHQNVIELQQEYLICSFQAFSKYPQLACRSGITGVFFSVHPRLFAHYFGKDNLQPFLLICSLTSLTRDTCGIITGTSASWWWATCRLFEHFHRILKFISCTKKQGRWSQNINPSGIASVSSTSSADFPDVNTAVYRTAASFSAWTETGQDHRSHGYGQVH